LTERLSYTTKFETDASLLPHCNVGVKSLKDDIVIGRITANNLEVNQDNEMMIYRVSLNSIVLEKDCIVL
jgi:hypothetical protein